METIHQKAAIGMQRASGFLDHKTRSSYELASPTFARSKIRAPASSRVSQPVRLSAARAVHKSHTESLRSAFPCASSLCGASKLNCVERGTFLSCRQLILGQSFFSQRQSGVSVRVKAASQAQSVEKAKENKDDSFPFHLDTAVLLAGFAFEAYNDARVRGLEALISLQQPELLPAAILKNVEGRI